MHRFGRVAAIAAAALFAAACNKTPEPEPTKVAGGASSGAPPAASVAGKPNDATPRGPADIAWDVPPSWALVNKPNPMRRATYHVPPAAGDPDEAELSVARAGGSVEMNIARWKEQFRGGPDDFPKREQRNVGDFKITIVEHRGAFDAQNVMPGQAAAPPSPHPHWAMLAAIVEVGVAPYFFKLTGPEKTVKASRADFDKLVDSIRAR